MTAIACCFVAMAAVIGYCVGAAIEMSKHIRSLCEHNDWLRERIRINAEQIDRMDQILAAAMKYHQ